MSEKIENTEATRDQEYSDAMGRMVVMQASRIIDLERRLRSRDQRIAELHRDVERLKVQSERKAIELKTIEETMKANA